nr:Chain C, LARGE T ANTIGEN1BK6_E Chain E, LARGE T ANTIGEN
KKKRKV